MDSFRSFIHCSRYARWRVNDHRRETWVETVDRWWDWLSNRFPQIKERIDIRQAVLDHEIMPSMRLLMTAGPAVDRDNTCAYNCAYLEMDSIDAFKEQMFILLCGTGVGHSEESRVVRKVPNFGTQLLNHAFRPIVVEDSKEGWSDAYAQVLSSLLVKGELPTWDTRKVRPKGSRLKTFGGRSSGPGPLVDLFSFVTEKCRSGKPLTTQQVHDINCVSGANVVVGGVRRSAEIALSDLDDSSIATCKSGRWFDEHAYRQLANNSAVYEDRPSLEVFNREWKLLHDSYSGERGIFNRGAARRRCAELGRDPHAWYGTNPCGEILLLPKEFCNLTSTILRAEDTYDSIRRKVEMSTILGTLQSALTYFPYLRAEWRNNCEAERLLGVSLSGIYDCPLTNGSGSERELVVFLEDLRDLCRKVNVTWARQLGINPSVARTCVKPEGTVGCLTDCAHGMHPRFARFYFRRVRIDKKDPLYLFMKNAGVPVEDDVSKPDDIAVFTFAMKAPEGAITQRQVNPLSHLHLWKIYKEHWCDHNPSVTINYTEDNFEQCGKWVWDNFDSIQGLSFLPLDDHTYAQAPFEEITEEQYLNHPKVDVDFANLRFYETEDGTASSQTLSCTGGACELVDITGDR